MQGELVDKGRLIALLPTDKLAKMVEVCFRLDIPFEEVKRSGNGFSQNKRILKNIRDQIDGMDPDQVRGKILEDFRLSKWPGDETTADEMLARYRGSIEWNPHRSLAHVTFPNGKWSGSMDAVVESVLKAYIFQSLYLEFYRNLSCTLPNQDDKV
ncbi:hypothetical protein [Anaerolinea sp.]|uniref:hypothetical protein n=1 Tax=Anaerolinea sp. TaxID=1872519 RepID=UPI002ACDC2AF|nr:hypothetical protein [Anaerolinea sp.]